LNTSLFDILLGIPLAAAIACGFIRKRQVLQSTTLSGAALTVAASGLLAWRVFYENTVSTKEGFFYADALTAFVVLIVSGSALVVAVCSAGYLDRQVKNGNVDEKMLRLYYVLLNLFVFTMLLVLVSNNLGFMWISIEGTTLATAFLVAFYDRESSLEAAWKYVIICSVGIALALFGIILTYYSALNVVPSAGTPMNWTTLMSVAKNLDPAVLKLAFIFILVGFGTKAGLAPMHTWKPDAYAEAPAPITALMASGLVNVALYALIRFTILLNKAVGGSFAQTLLMIIGLLSMVVALPFILVQKDLKRLLAYSSIEQIGIVAFALGLGTPLGYFGASLHMLNNAIIKLVMFVTVGNIRLAYNSKIIRRITGAARIVPASATLLMVGTFALTGWPPFGLFTSELTIATAGFSGGKIVPAVLFIGIVAGVFVGFISYVSEMVFGEPPQNVKAGEPNRASIIVLAVLLLLSVVSGTAMPQVLYAFLQKVALVLQG
jgi:hydrogenase-4 component F